LATALATLGRSTASDGTNPDLNDPIASALEDYGILPADRSNVSDDDLSKIDDSIQGQFVDWTEIRALEAFANDIAFKPRYQQWDDYRVDRNNMLEALRGMIKDKTQQFNTRHNSMGSLRAVAIAPPVEGILTSHPRHDRRGYLDVRDL
ncbi:hypothetical protein ACYOEI_24260, partial [Singulisphaera rosea]